MPDAPTWGNSQQPEPQGSPQPDQETSLPSAEGWGQGAPPGGPSWQSAAEARAWQPGAYPAGPPGHAAGPSAEDYVLPPSTVPVVAHRSGRHGRAWLAVASAVVLAAAGTSTSVVVAETGGSGAGSPAAAVQELIGSLDNSDVIGVLDAVDPGERNALEPGLDDIFGQLKRLGILSSTADLNAITGIDISEQALATSTDQLAPDVAAVTVSGGTNTESINPGRLPLGSYFQRLADKAMGGRSLTTTGPNSGSTTLGTVRVDGGWYVSLGYSIAINALRAAGQSGAPPATGQLQAAGASSPEGAVQALFNDASQLDLSALMADLDPAEMAAADAYVPDWLPKAQAALDKARGKVSIQFGNLSFTTQQVDSGTLVKVGAGLTVTVKDQASELKYANGCYTYSTMGTTKHQCAQGSDQYLARLEALLPPPVQPIFTRLTTMKPDLGFVTVDEDGAWYVSPTRTYLAAISAFLSELRPGDVQTVIANASGIGSAFEKYLQQQMGRSSLGNGASTGLPGSPIAGTFSPAGSSAYQATAEANVVNAFTDEMGYYASSSGFTANGEALDPVLPWSPEVAKGRVAVSVGCDTVAGVPATFEARDCHGRPPQVVVLRALASDGSACYSIVADQSRAGPGAVATTWYNFAGSCASKLPAGPPRTGRARNHFGPDWYQTF